MGCSIRSASSERVRIVLLALLVAAASVRADASPGTQETEQSAIEYFRQGRTLHGEGKYADAIVAYQAAYVLAPRPELMFNIAQCYRLLGDAANAVTFYEHYLVAVPHGPGSEEARAHIAALRRMATRESPDVGGVPAGRWIGLTTAAVGLVFGGLATWQGIEAHDAAARLEEAHGPFTPELAEVERHGRNAERNMWILGGVGAALVVAGGVTWWLSREPERPRVVTAAPVLAPGVTGMVVLVRY